MITYAKTPPSEKDNNNALDWMNQSTEDRLGDDRCKEQCPEEATISPHELTSSSIQKQTFYKRPPIEQIT